MSLKDSYIHGDRFREIADFIVDERRKILPRNYRNSRGIILCHTHYVDNLFRTLNRAAGEFVLITHNSDECVTPVRLRYCPPCIKHWFGQNVIVKHDKVTPIPIGLERPGVGKSGEVFYIEKALSDIAKHSVCDKVYMNFSLRTNRVERGIVYNRLVNQPFVTNRVNGRTLAFSEYIEELINHTYAVSPPGNGPDCIRTWEALYVGTVPIVKQSVFNNYFSSLLPMIVVSRWDQVVPEHISLEHDRLTKKNWNYEALDINFWFRKIKEAMDA